MSAHASRLPLAFGLWLLLVGPPGAALGGSSSLPQPACDTVAPAAPPDSTLMIEQVRVQGVRFQQIIAPQVLAGDELKRLNSLSVADAIRYFSGVQIKDYGGVGGLKTLDVRSMGTHHVGVFYDGVQLGNAQNGVVDLGKLSLDNVESIMLYNGQKSEVMQSAKDFGHAGSVYILTRRPRFEGDRRHNFRSALRVGSFGLLNPSALWEVRLRPGLSASLNAEWTSAHGRYPFRYQRSAPDGSLAYDTTAMRANGDLWAVRAESAFYGRLPRGSWRARLYHYQSERGMPGAIVNNVWHRAERLWDANSFAQVMVQTDLSGRYRVQLVAKVANDRTRYVNRDDRSPRIDRRYLQREVYITTSHRLRIARWLDASLAYDAQWNHLLVREGRQRRVPHDFPYPTRLTQYLSGALALSLWGVKLQGSLLVTAPINRVRRYHQPPDFWALLPALFASYTPSEALGVSVRAFYKRSLRLPSFNDLYYTEIGNAYLRPEHVTQFDFGAQWGYERRGGWVHRAECSADVYYNVVRDKIVAYPRGQQFRWTMLNLGLVRILGVEGSAGALATLWPGGSFSARVRYAWQRAEDITNPADSYYGHQIPYAPWHSGALTLGISHAGWALSYSTIYVGQRYNQRENIVYNHMQPWYTSDVALSYTHRLWGCQVRLSLEVNNLYDQAYDVILNYPMPGRNYRAQLQCSY